MPTSATGPRNKPGRRASRGFTLLEVMVVVAIIGVLLAVVRLALPDRRAETLAAEARRFVAALEDCRDSAVLSGAPVGIRLRGEAYGFEYFRGRWQPRLTPRGDLDLHRLPAGLEIALSRPGGARPAVVCLPDGETRIGAVALGERGARAHYRFHDDADGAFVADWVGPPS